MVIYDRERGDISVSAQQGEFDLENSRVSLHGNVLLKSEDGQSIMTDYLEFDSQANLLSSEKRVEVVSGQMQLVGVGLRYDLDQGILRMRSSIEAVFKGGTIKLP